MPAALLCIDILLTYIGWHCNSVTMAMALQACLFLLCVKVSIFVLTFQELQRCPLMNCSACKQTDTQVIAAGSVASKHNDNNMITILVFKLCTECSKTCEESVIIQLVPPLLQPGQRKVHAPLAVS